MSFNSEITLKVGLRLNWRRNDGTYSCEVVKVCDGGYAVLKVEGWQGTHWEHIDFNFTLAPPRAEVATEARPVQNPVRLAILHTGNGRARIVGTFANGREIYLGDAMSDRGAKSALTRRAAQFGLTVNGGEAR